MNRNATVDARPAPQVGRTVAVVIAAFNASRTIDAALASVATQTRPPHEVLVVDDASVDDTAERAARWSAMLPIKVISVAENGGPAAARHAAILACRSELVALLDADDAWLPDHLEVLTDLYGSGGGIVSARPIRWIPGAGTYLAAPADPPPPGGQLTTIVDHNFVFIGALFAVADYVRVGGFRSGMTGAEDWDLWVRMVRAGATIRTASHATVVYRLSTGSLTSADRTLDAEIGVLRRAEAEAASPAERAAVRRSLRRHLARRRLIDAYSLARAGEPLRARARVLGALAGPRPVALRALGLLASPRWAVRQRDAKRFEPKRWLRK